MSKVSIGFSRPKRFKPLSWLIRKIEGTEYSHAFVTWHCDNIDRRKVFEAVGSGIRILSNVNFKKHALIVELYDFHVDDQTLFKIEQEAHDVTGRSYGLKSLLGLAIMRLFNMFNRILGLKGKQHNPFKDGDYSMVCVEAGGLVLRKINKELPKNFEDYGLLEFNDLVKKYGERVI